MMPNLWSGDTVSVRGANPADVLPGQIVVFARNRYFVAHRVVRRAVVRNEVVLITRGDSQRSDDPPVDSTEFIGVVTAAHRGGARLPLPRRRPLAARGVAWLVRRSARLRSLLDRLNAVRLHRSLRPTAAAGPALQGRA